MIPAALAGAAVSAGLNYGVQSLMSDKEQKDYEKNQQRNFEYSQELQRNSAKNAVEGLKLAGLSPALAAGGFSTAPASMSSAPMQNKAPTADVAGMFQVAKQMEILDAEKQALQGQANKANAEADKTNVEVGRMSKEDKESKDAMLRSIDRLTTQYKNAGLDTSSLDSFRENVLNSQDFNAGALKANLDAINYEKALSNVSAGEVDDALETLISQKKIKGDVASDIVEMSHSQRKLLARQVLLAIKQYSLLGAQIKVADSEEAVNQSKLASLLEERKKLQKEQEYIAQQTEQSKATTNKIKNGDFQTAYETGDTLKTIRILGLDGVESLLKLLGLMVTKGK